MRILIFGDSIVWGAWDTEGGWVARLRKTFSEQAIASGFENYHSVYNLGISGNTTRDILNRFEEEAKSRFEDGEKCIVFAVGVNDSQFDIETKESLVPTEEFKQNLLRLIGEAEKITPRILFIGLLPVEDEKLNPMPWEPTHGYATDYVRRYEQIIKEVAEGQGVQFIPLLDEFLEKDFKGLLIDGIHPTNEGHSVIAQIVQRELKNLGWLDTISLGL